MIKSLSILITSFMPGLAMADTVTGAEVDLTSIALDFANFVVPTAIARVPEAGILPMLAAAGVIGIAVKYMIRKK